MSPRIDGGGIDGTAGFDQDVIPSLTELGNQWKGVRLGERFATRDFHEPATIRLDLPQNVFNGLFVSSIEGVFRIAPGAAQRTAGQPYEDAGLPDKARFALDAMKHLCHAHVRSNPRPGSLDRARCAACRGSD